MATAVLVLIALLGAGAPAAPSSPFTLRILAPDPFHIAGATTIEAAAFDADGALYDAIAWMSLSLDGGPQQHDDAPPWSWTVEADGARRHRVAIVAVARDGRRATVSALSSATRWVDAVSVTQVLVPVVVRARSSDGAKERVVAGLGAGDFTLLEDGAARPIVSFSSEPPAGAVVLAFDTSLSMEAHLWSARRAASEFVNTLPAAAMLSLLTFNDDVHLEQDFTGDRAALRDALGAARTGGSRTALHEALRVGARHLTQQTGPRTLVIFTDGMDTRDEDDGSLRTAIEAAQGADVAVYGIAWGTEATAALERMTGGTGGELFAPSGGRELNAAFASIAESLGSRYLLGFEPSRPSEPGYRSIEVRVAREGVRVHARAGYRVGSAPSNR